MTVIIVSVIDILLLVFSDVADENRNILAANATCFDKKIFSNTSCHLFGTPLSAKSGAF